MSPLRKTTLDLIDYCGCCLQRTDDIRWMALHMLYAWRLDWLMRWWYWFFGLDDIWLRPRLLHGLEQLFPFFLPKRDGCGRTYEHSYSTDVVAIIFCKICFGTSWLYILYCPELWQQNVIIDSCFVRKSSDGHLCLCNLWFFDKPEIIHLQNRLNRMERKGHASKVLYRPYRFHLFSTL